ncbi:GNAT family N-acetyltransferase [Thermococcus peptonophilus]|uniref:Ribosomal protein-serine acetyltransferase n=1 Tax=Thermococcus peptonophilus TaxID=53952 RepID=A0A142CTD5_9EURY|nr:GNAT family protein [Thermococcus peptonophilus]AMQ18037.1 ribosomal protein-serine acetyltransferase [Thermococcus peptonophilus]
MRPVVIKGKLVSLAVPTKDDVRRAWLWYNDRDVRRFLSDPDGLFFFEDELEWYEAVRRGKRENRVFTVLETSSKSPVGFVGLHKINHKDGHAELGYFIAKEYWNRGYATEAVELALKYAFEWLNLRKVYARVYEPNIASIRVLEKNGFELVGRMKKHSHIPGYGFVDELIFEKFREE